MNREPDTQVREECAERLRLIDLYGERAGELASRLRKK
jgi:hypothetical protein